MNNFNDYGDFMGRDQFFTPMPPPPNHAANNSANSFPIGTFSIEQTTPMSQSNQVFPTPDYFNAQTNGMNGGSANFNSTSANNNNNGTDPTQATRETGIIEKLLVMLIDLLFKLVIRNTI